MLNGFSLTPFAGQSLKDIIRWPRPSYPAARLQKKWGLEYGMPSTHAMVSVAIPFSVLIYTYDRYIYSMPVGLAIACVWCAVICVSRVYLGMHSVLVSIGPPAPLSLLCKKCYAFFDLGHCRRTGAGRTVDDPPNSDRRSIGPCNSDFPLVANIRALDIDTTDRVLSRSG